MAYEWIGKGLIACSLLNTMIQCPNSHSNEYCFNVNLPGNGEHLGEQEGEQEGEHDDEQGEQGLQDNLRGVSGQYGSGQYLRGVQLGRQGGSGRQDGSSSQQALAGEHERGLLGRQGEQDVREHLMVLQARQEHGPGALQQLLKTKSQILGCLLHFLTL